MYKAERQEELSAWDAKKLTLARRRNERGRHDKGKAGKGGRGP